MDGLFQRFIATATVLESLASLEDELVMPSGDFR